MATAWAKFRKNQLRELVYVAHTADPKAFVESLKDTEKLDGWEALASGLGDKKMAEKIKRDALAKRLIEASLKNGR